MEDSNNIYSLMKVASNEPGLLFRSPGEKNHDYDPNWDYTVEEAPDPELAKLAAGVSQLIYNELKSKGVIDRWMFGFEVWAANLDGEEAVAMYISGTYDFPVILIDLEQHREYQDQIGQSIRHELKHAQQESADEDFDEDEAEFDN